MSTNAALGNELRALYAAESARLQREFSATGDGRAAVQGRTALVESLALRLWKELISPEADGPRNFALVALGGFGRRWLFPYSDIDILLLHGGGTEQEYKSRIRSFSQEMWDLRLKLSPATRTLGECEKFDPNNVEFTISLLDCRYLAGDPNLFARLHDQVIPKLVAREARAIVQRLTDLTRGRYNKFGNTVFHLEPNIKDGPGGLRDYNLACWLALIAAMEEKAGWPDEQTLLPPWLRAKMGAALDFLMSVRCFLHFRHGRDDNTLAWVAQDEAAAEKVGAPGAGPLTASDWMRFYFGHARLIHRVATQLLEEFPAARPSLYRQFQNLRSRLSNSEFAVVDGRIFLQRAESLEDPELPLRMFRFMARHGLHLSSATEHQMEESLPALAAAPPQGAELWHYLQDILLAPHAAEALRTMHLLRLLTALVPEFEAIDSLVIRDYSHRFTVDEHSFVTIENLHDLRKSASKWDQRYAEILDELEQPDLLYLALLLHDTGKGAKSDSHVTASLEIAERCLDRLELDPPDRETVLFLIGHHLDLSAAMRRDIFDPGNDPPACGEGGDARAPEDALPAHLRRYQGGESRGPHAVEGGEHLAALHRRGQFHDAQRGRAAARERGQRGDDPPPHAGAGRREKAPDFSGRLAAALSGDAHGQRRHPPHGNGGTSGRRSRASVADARAPLVRADARHSGPALPVRQGGRRAGRLGDEHRQGRGLFEPARAWLWTRSSSPTVFRRWS